MRLQNQQMKVVIDGSNVALAHGQGKYFSCRGIKIASEYFQALGYREIIVFVPQWMRQTPQLNNPIEGQSVLEDLKECGILMFTPSRKVGGKEIVHNCDRYILNSAYEEGAVITSNNDFSELIRGNSEWREFTTDRFLPFCFDEDRLVISTDVLDRLIGTQFLRSEMLSKSLMKDNLRHVVVDGSNVAMTHGKGKLFSCRGLEIVVEYFRKRGHQQITVLVPSRRRQLPPSQYNPIVDQNVLDKLQNDKVLIYTPRRNVAGRVTECYDDRFILRLANETGGIVVSTDHYRDLFDEVIECRNLIAKRLLPFIFVGDRFMPPDDPLGENGPTLEQFLTSSPESEDCQLDGWPADSSPGGYPRMIVIDGYSVAKTHGNEISTNSFHGIQLVYNYFRIWGHDTIKICLPSCCMNEITEQLEGVSTFVLSGASFSDYHRFILETAAEMEGVIVTNEDLTEVYLKNPEWRISIDERVLPFVFAGDLFMPSDDPLGRNGPSLNEFLTYQPQYGDIF